MKQLSGTNFAVVFLSAIIAWARNVINVVLIGSLKTAVEIVFMNGAMNSATTVEAVDVIVAVATFAAAIVITADLAGKMVNEAIATVIDVARGGTVKVEYREPEFSTHLPRFIAPVVVVQLLTVRTIFALSGHKRS